MSDSFHDKATLRAVAQLHIENLDKSFLATLGAGFLTEMYRAMDRAQDCVLLVEHYEGEVAGFVTGGNGMGPIYKAMIPRILIWGWGLALKLLSPKRLSRVLDILRYDGGENSADIPAELFSIAVSPKARGKGLAPKLYNRLVEYFKNHNVEAFRIIVGKDLLPAHKFYLKMGAQKEGELELHAGETSTLYIQKTK